MVDQTRTSTFVQLQEKRPYDNKFDAKIIIIIDVNQVF